MVTLTSGHGITFYAGSKLMRDTSAAQIKARATAKAMAINVPARPRRLSGRPSDTAMALLLVAISATGSLGAIAFWIAGHGYVGLRVLSGAILLILGLVLA